MFYSYDGIQLAVRPKQDPLEIWLGGQVPAALRRCGRIGEGWMPGLCSPEEAAVMRELHEEIGVEESAVKILGQTNGWLKYDLPLHMRRNNSTPGFVGQKQKWFLLEMLENEAAVQMDITDKPEFDDFQWVSYYYPITQVVEFKQEVYRTALLELAQYLPGNQ